ncbi:MAG: MCE family protein [Opitutales bacterium]|nr:MCE family protein [Opitutales bacterium]
MSHSSNKTAIGIFTVVFGVLLLASIIFFGKFSFNRDKAQFVIYFSDSLNGLDVGSAVKFKGVKVGSVKSIKMQLRGSRAEDLSVPVVIEIDHANANTPSESLRREKLDEAILEGLRARLQLTSIVTGLLYVDLDFMPGTPIILHREAEAFDAPEIPAVPSNTSQMMKAVSTILQDLSNAKFSELSAQLKQTAERINQGLGEIEFEKINANVVRLTDSAATLLEAPELKNAVANANRLIGNIDTLSAHIANQVDPVAQEIKHSLADLRSTLSEISLAIQNLQTLVMPRQGSIGQEFGDALVQINDAARAVRALADFLQVQISSGEKPPHTK